MGRSTTIKNGKELEVCDSSRVLDLRESHTAYAYTYVSYVYANVIDSSCYSGVLSGLPFEWKRGES